MTNKPQILKKNLFILVLLICLPFGASSHFRAANWQSVIHVAHMPDQIKVYARLPAALLLADAVNAEGLTDAASAQLITPEGALEDRLFVWNVSALDSEQAEILQKIVLQALSLETEDFVQRGTIEALRIHPLFTEPNFGNLGEARRAMRGSLYSEEIIKSPFVGESYIDAIVTFHRLETEAMPSLKLSLASDKRDDSDFPEAEQGAESEYFLVDYYPGAPKLMIRQGDGPHIFVLDGKVTDSIFSLIKQGITHILGGPDHLLYVICLAWAALTLTRLAFIVTGFTLGHSISLALGYFAVRPEASWFMPLIEIGIAASILYAAWSLWSEHRLSSKPHLITTMVATASIGLLHGYGFSNFLTIALDPKGMFVIPGLIAFNFGVEIGQLVIISAVWPVAMWLRRKPQFWTRVRRGFVIIACAIALYWTVERGQTLFHTLTF